MARKQKQDPFAFAQQEEQLSDEAGRPDEQKAGTYRIGAETKRRVDELAERWNVTKGDLARYLLNYALDAVDSGELSPPETHRPGPKRIIF